jgi:excisionase family DNA binding protein
MANEDVKPLAWSIDDWAKTVGCSRAYVYELLGEKKISSKKLGAKRLIMTAPLDFLLSLPDPAEKAAA